MWDDKNGGHIYEMSAEENGYYEPDDDLSEEDLQYYSEDHYYD